MFFLIGAGIRALTCLHIGFPLLVWELLQSKGYDIFITDRVKREVRGGPR